MKKIIFVALFIITSTFIGCKTSDSYCQIDPKPETTYSQRFDNTSYVWESLYFPTNKTSGVQ